MCSDLCATTLVENPSNVQATEWISDWSEMNKIKKKNQQIIKLTNSDKFNDSSNTQASWNSSNDQIGTNPSNHSAISNSSNDQIQTQNLIQPTQIHEIIYLT